MKQLIILVIEFILIVALIIGIYSTNLSRKVEYPHQKSVVVFKRSLPDLNIEKELFFFISKELGLYGQDFQVLDAVYLYTNELTGADYILVTLRTSDGRLCQVTVSKNFLPWAKWEMHPGDFSMAGQLQHGVEPDVETPAWMRDLMVTSEQLQRYYDTHPDIAREGEIAFFDDESGKYKLPSDWYQSVFVLVTEKDKSMRLISETGAKAQGITISSFWKADYPTDYLGPGYREYLYGKIKSKK